ncbi:uncharacterized protein [Muntiacus reevesi]|uniref:uncharacterized protein n=1 Tax=Muntiacus reevesi TaxID=9886 RepID=UPI003306DBE4
MAGTLPHPLTCVRAPALGSLLPAATPAPPAGGAGTGHRDCTRFRAAVLGRGPCDLETTEQGPSEASRASAPRRAIPRPAHSHTPPRPRPHAAPPRPHAHAAPPPRTRTSRPRPAHTPPRPAHTQPRPRAHAAPPHPAHTHTPPRPTPPTRTRRPAPPTHAQLRAHSRMAAPRAQVRLTPPSCSLTPRVKSASPPAPHARGAPDAVAPPPLRALVKGSPAAPRPAPRAQTGVPGSWWGPSGVAPALLHVGPVQTARVRGSRRWLGLWSGPDAPGWTRSPASEMLGAGPRAGKQGRSAPAVGQDTPGVGSRSSSEVGVRIPVHTQPRPAAPSGGRGGRGTADPEPRAVVLDPEYGSPASSPRVGCPPQPRPQQAWPPRSTNRGRGCGQDGPQTPQSSRVSSPTPPVPAPALRLLKPPGQGGQAQAPAACGPPGPQPASQEGRLYSPLPPLGRALRRPPPTLSGLSQRSRPGRPRRLSPWGLQNVNAYKPWVSSREKPEMSDL